MTDDRLTPKATPRAKKTGITTWAVRKHPDSNSWRLDKISHQPLDAGYITHPNIPTYRCAHQQKKYIPYQATMKALGKLAELAETTDITEELYNQTFEREFHNAGARTGSRYPQFIPSKST